MKIKLNGASSLRFERLIETLNNNIYNSSTFVTLLSSKDRYLLSNLKRPLSKDECTKLLDDYLLDGEEPSFFLGYELIKLDESDYLDNPYYKNIKLNEIKEGKIAFKTVKLKAYEPFVIKDVTTTKNYEEITSLGYFEHDYSYISLTQNKVIWMSLSPYEIETMKEDILNAKGNVLTYGLGIGYFAYMCSLKDEVETVTIVEKDKNIISFFKKHILNKFSHKEKIIIIEEDAFKFNKESLYDYIFIDIYRNEDDGLKLYLDFKKQDKENYHFWIENSFVVMLRRYLLDLMDLYNNEDNETINYLRKENEIYSYLDELTNDLEFNSINAIEEFLSDSNIKELVSKK